jgi:hypothetical protein
MPQVGFEPTIPASKRAKAVHALDNSAPPVDNRFILSVIVLFIHMSPFICQVCVHFCGFYGLSRFFKANERIHIHNMAIIPVIVCDVKISASNTSLPDNIRYNHLWYPWTGYWSFIHLLSLVILQKWFPNISSKIARRCRVSVMC